VVVTTTHYDSLKTLAQTSPKFVNGAMEYDLEKLEPTYRLKVGVPGRSYAFDIASRMGLPRGLLARARALTGSASIGLEEVIAKLEAREAALASEETKLAQARAEAEQAAGEGKAAAEKLAAREKELAKDSRKAIDEAVREAREALRAIVREAQAAGSARAAEQARARVESAAAAVTANLPKEPPPSGDTPALSIGMAVWVPSLKTDAVIVKLPQRERPDEGRGGLAELRSRRRRAPAAEERNAESEARCAAIDQAVGHGQ